MVRAMRTRPILLAALAAAALVACGDDGGTPTIDARLPDAQTDAAACVPVDDSNECTTDECVNDLPVNTPRTGATCAGGGTCNSAGMCVAAASCTDNMMNGTETGVDCGGSCAPVSTCGVGIGCGVAADCTSGVCSGSPMTCQAARCGDGIMQAGEMCDDGNDTNGDGCDDGAGDACRATGCGNGVVTGTEVCDDGNAVNNDGCDNNCTVTACGNGVTAGTETCDQGNTTAGDGCSATCAIEAGYTCTTVVPSVCTTICGDGIIAGAETCDQGNTTAGDGCSATCTVEAGYACTGTPSVCATVCGNGVMTAPETCDDGNIINYDGCSSLCRTERTELEPNEDGTPSTGGTTTVGNDFDVGGMLAINNATAQGPVLASVGSVNLQGALSVGASPGTAGDEDVYALTNNTAAQVEFQLDVWNRAAGFGFGVSCGTSIDTAINIRDAAGAVLITGDDRSTPTITDFCSRVNFIVAAGATVYAQVVEFGDNAVIPAYSLQAQTFGVACGDNRVAPVVEECDDGNTTAGDGCSATCQVEGTAETEPNEDGMPATGGSGIVGNDFDSAGGMAVANATAQGVLSLTGTNGRIWIGSLRVGASPGTAGDEDVYAVTNAGTAAIEVQADTYDAATGLNRPCLTAFADTGINVRDAAGVVVTSNDNSAAGGSCSRVTFVLLAGQTRYVHVTESGDNAIINRYFLAVVSRPIVCGDNTQVPGVEECDDGNTTAGDGCSATCVVEGTAETEPNEDGMPATGGSGIGGNDFDSAGGMAVANATAQGVLSLTGTNGRTWIGSLRIGASPGTAGDEDVYAVTNSGTAAIEVQADTYDAATGINRACITTNADTGINVRDAMGGLITSNDTSPIGGGCSRVVFVLLPGQTRYLHVTEFGDNAIIARYFLVVASRLVVCGNGVRTAGAEACDDGNTAAGDGCSATCTVETGFSCNTASPTVCIANLYTPIALACTDMTAATTLATAGDDDEGVSANTALPFPVSMFGGSMVSFSASANGVMQLFTTASGTSTATFSNPSTVPSATTPNGWLAPFWDDLDVAVVSTLTTGASPSRRFTVQWNAEIFNVAGTNVRFQTQFVEGGAIEFHYCAAAGDAAHTTGSGATVGVESAAGTAGQAIGINTANTITSGTSAFRWNIP